MENNFENQYKKYIMQANEAKKLNDLIDILYPTGTKEQKRLKAFKDGLINQREYCSLKDFY